MLGIIWNYTWHGIWYAIEQDIWPDIVFFVCSISFLVSGHFVTLILVAIFLSVKSLHVRVLHGVYLLRLTSLFWLCFLCAQSIIFSSVNATLCGTTFQIIHWASPCTKAWIAPKPCCHLKAFSWSKWGPTLLLWSRILLFLCVSN